MRRTKFYNKNENQVPLKELYDSALVARKQLFHRLGMSYDGERDLYEALGYELSLEFDDFYQQYQRQDIAKAIINRPTKATWQGNLEIIETDDDKQTELEKAWIKLDKRLKLKNKFLRVDRLTGIGKYGILLLGVNDVTNKEDWKNPIKSNNNKLLYIKPVSEVNAKIHSYIEDTKNERYGLPKLYQITLAKPNQGSNTEEIFVHFSRVIHIIDEQLESEVVGMPRLEGVFNRLKDLEKIVGGSAEMFWRGARPGYNASLKDNYQMSPAVWDDLQNQIDEYEHKLRRILTLEGFDLKNLDTQVDDPKNHVDVQIQMISAVTGIPKRILTGSERGELSSSQDQDEWDTWIKSRREEFAESQIIRPFVDWCIKYGILPKPKKEDEYHVKWEDLFAQSDKEKAEVGRIRAEALKAYSANPLAESILPPDAFLEFLMGLSTEQIELIKQMLEVQMQEEQILEEELQSQTTTIE
jgi:hypothetical protein